MPSTVVIPQHEELHCEPCKYHKVVACSLGDGVTDFKEWGCTNQKSLVVHQKAAGYSVWEMDERVKDGKIGHRYIGRMENCPSWCPLLSKADDAVHRVADVRGKLRAD